MKGKIQRNYPWETVGLIGNSDILTEIDGFPSSSSLSILNRDTDDEMETAASISHDALLADASADAKAFIENHVKLRSFVNRVLHHLYTPNKAYAQPHELADLVCSLSAELRQWYQILPLEQQFVRDATIFSLHVPSMSLRVVSDQTFLYINLDERHPNHV